MCESNNILSEFEENQIFVMHKNGFTQKAIADLLDVSPKTIWRYLHKYVPVLSMKGIQNGNCRLTEVEVLEIRALYVPFEISYKEIAEQYNVGISTIKGIIRRETWKHI